MPIQRASFGQATDGKPVESFTLSSGKLSAKIITLGATIAELHTLDRKSSVGNIVLGHSSAQGYLGVPRTYFGCVVGRFANRIAKGRFKLDGVEYQLPQNNGPNTLHGGLIGIDRSVFSAEPIESSGGSPSLVLRHRVPDGQDGFPGNLDITVTYTLSADALRIDYLATTDKPTPVNLTNHSYFNLRGPGSGDVRQHIVRLSASRFTPVDNVQIPTGEIASTQNTVFDFQNPSPIGARLDKVPGPPPIGYDHNFVLDTNGDLSKSAGKVIEPTTGRTLEFFTTQPGVQFYTGNFLKGEVSGIGGVYNQHGAFCLETQNFPDAPNQPSFPNSILRPGENYRHSTIYRFGAE